MQYGPVDVACTTMAISYGTPDTVRTSGLVRAEDSADDWFALSAVARGIGHR